MGDPFHILFDDGTFVQIRRGVVCRGANHLHAPFPCPDIGVAALKRREKRVVDIDDLFRELLDKVIRKHLHVTGKDHQIDIVLLKQGEDLFLLRLFVPVQNGAAEKRHAELGCDFLQIRVVADDQRHFAVDVAILQMHQKIVQTVGGLGDEDRHALLGITVPDAPPGIQRIGKGFELLFQLLFGEGHGGNVKNNARKVLVLPDIRVLLAVQDVELPGGKERGDRGEDPLLVGTLHQKDRFFHIAGLQIVDVKIAWLII